MNLGIPELQPLLERIIAALPGALAVVAGSFVVKYLLNRALDLVADKTRFTRTDLAPVRKVGGWLIFALTIVLLLGVFGFNLGGLWAMLSTVLALVAIGFVAVWSVLSNVSCTVLIMVFRPFAVGDEIELAGEPVKGRVIDLNFFYTTLETDDGALLQIPNNLFFQRSVKRRRGSPDGEEISLSEQLQSRKPART